MIIDIYNLVEFGQFHSNYKMSRCPVFSELLFSQYFYILNQLFRLKVLVRSGSLQVDFQVIRHRVVQFLHFQLSAKTLMQLLRLVLQSLLYLSPSSPPIPHPPRPPPPNARCVLPKPKPKPNFLKDWKAHIVLFARLVRAVGEIGREKKEALLASGHRQLERGRHWPLNSELLARRNQSHGNLLCTRKPRWPSEHRDSQ